MTVEKSVVIPRETTNRTTSAQVAVFRYSLPTEPTDLTLTLQADEAEPSDCRELLQKLEYTWLRSGTTPAGYLTHVYSHADGRSVVDVGMDQLVACPTVADLLVFLNVIGVKAT